MKIDNLSLLITKSEKLLSRSLLLSIPCIIGLILLLPLEKYQIYILIGLYMMCIVYSLFQIYCFLDYTKNLIYARKVEKQLLEFRKKTHDLLNRCPLNGQHDTQLIFETPFEEIEISDGVTLQTKSTRYEDVCEEIEKLEHFIIPRKHWFGYKLLLGYIWCETKILKLRHSCNVA